jgi:hypothetical protein
MNFPPGEKKDGKKFFSPGKKKNRKSGASILAELMYIYNN